jgi:predicted kinase
MVLLSGVPGSGKSTFARALAAGAGATVIESDAVRRGMFPRPVHDRRENRSVFAAVHQQLARGLRSGRRVVVDATNLIEAERSLAYEVAEAAGARTVVVRTTAPAALLRRRVEERARGRDDVPGVRVLERMRRMRQPIRRPHFVVDTTGDTSAALAAVTREIERT